MARGAAWMVATLVVITHDPALAKRCGRVLTMADGRIATDSTA